MADSFKIIDPYSSYEMTPQADAKGVYGNDFLNAVKSLQVGFGSQVLRIDRQGLWLGAADFATAPFSVSMAGAMVATSLDLSNYLQVGQALTDVQSDIFDLSDINTDLGVITAGTLIGLEVRGGLIRTSTSGARVEIDGTTDSLEIFDASNKRRIMLDSDEIIFYDGTGAETGSLSALVSNIIGLTFPATKLGFVVYSGTTAKFAVSPNAVVVYDTLTAGGSGIDIGESSQPFDNLYIQDIYFTATTSNPTTNGQMRYYDSGSEGIRCQFGGSDFQFDATAV